MLQVGGRKMPEKYKKSILLLVYSIWYLVCVYVCVFIFILIYLLVDFILTFCCCLDEIRTPAVRVNICILKSKYLLLNTL